jgi:drug/metabolite transporter, DME family
MRPNRSNISFGTAGLALVAAAATLWGTGGIAAKEVLRLTAMSPIEVGFYRLGISAPVLLPISLYLTGASGFSNLRRDWGRVAALAAATALYQVFYYNAVSRAGVAIATLVTICLAPPVVAVFSNIFLHERSSRRIWIAMAMTLAGVVLLIGWPDAAAVDDGGLGLGMISAFGAAVSYATMVLVSRSLASRHNAATLVVVGFGGGALLLLPLVLWQGFSRFSSPDAFTLLLYLGLVPTALAYLFFFIGMRRAPAAAASIVSLLEPLVATLLGTFLLREQMSVIGWTGAGLMLVGLLVLQFKRS